MERMRSWLLAAVVAFVAYFLGGLIAPLIHPYKMFSLSTRGEIAEVQLRSLGDAATYVAPNVLQAYVGLITIFVIAYGLIRLRNRYAAPLFYFALGAYYDIMLNGGEAARAHASFDRAIEPTLPTLTQMPLYVLLPLVLMLVLPLAAAFLLSIATNARR